MSAHDALSGPQFGTAEQRLLVQHSVWPEPSNSRHVQGIVDKHAMPAPGPLYRGISVHPGNAYLDPSKVKVGDRMHLPVSSFTSDREVGHGFANAADNEEHVGDYRSVLLEAHGAHGVPMEHVSNMPHEHEWLAHGQFEVTHHGSDPANDIEHHIRLRRV